MYAKEHVARLPSLYPTVILEFEPRFFIDSPTPGVFRTHAVTWGVDPTFCCYYKSARRKQYFKEGMALRTELVMSNTNDFRIGRRVCAENEYALRAVGVSAKG
jgi:hypothetical protein